MHRRWLPVFALALVVVGCSGPKSEGGRCSEDSDCAGDLVCKHTRCRIDAKLHQEMARQSGVVVSGERAAPTTEMPGAVRIRSASGRGFAFAVCADDERLIGGWCSPLTVGSDNTSSVHQSVGGNTATDTIGAQWKCDHPKVRVEAFALCQKLVALPVDGPPSAPTKPPTGEPAPSSGSGDR